MAKQQPRRSRRKAPGAPNLAAAQRALRQALGALGEDDPALPLVRSALSSVERRLSGKPKRRRGEWGGQIELVEAETARGRRWQIKRGKRVLKSGPLEALDEEQRRLLRKVVELFARQHGATLVDRLQP